MLLNCKESYNCCEKRTICNQDVHVHTCHILSQGGTRGCMWLWNRQFVLLLGMHCLQYKIEVLMLSTVLVQNTICRCILWKKWKLCNLAAKLRNIGSFYSKWFIKCFFDDERYSQTLRSVTGRLVEWELGASSRLTGGGRGGLTNHTRRAILATNGRNPLLVPLMPRASSLRRCKLHHPYC